MSGVAHPTWSGHSSEPASSRGPHANNPSFRNTISLDQIAAEHVGPDVRYSYLGAGHDRRESLVDP